jgi:hypothetical protein
MVDGGKPARIAGVRQNQGLPRLELTALKKWLGPGSQPIQKLAGSQTRFSLAAAFTQRPAGPLSEMAVYLLNPAGPAGWHW